MDGSNGSSSPQYDRRESGFINQSVPTPNAPILPAVDVLQRGRFSFGSLRFSGEAVPVDEHLKGFVTLIPGFCACQGENLPGRIACRGMTCALNIVTDRPFGGRPRRNFLKAAMIRPSRRGLRPCDSDGSESFVSTSTESILRRLLPCTIDCSFWRSSSVVSGL